MSYLLIVRLPNLVATSDNFSAYTQLGVSFIRHQSELTRKQWYLSIVRLPNLVATSDNFSAHTQRRISFIRNQFESTQKQREN